MTSDMAQWSKTAPLQSAIEQLLAATAGLQTTELTEQLPLLADTCFEAGWSGSADLLGLLTELLEAEDPESALSPEQQQHLQALFSLLPSATRAQPSVEQLSAVLSTLSGTDWQSPLDPEDLEALPELLQEDWQHADISAAAEPVESPQALAERLQVEAEPLAELDNPLPSDLAALAIELIDRCEDPELPIIGEAEVLIQALIDSPERDSAAAVIEMLASDAWPEPLDVEDVAEQRVLLAELFPEAELETGTEPETELQSDAPASPEALAEQLAELAEPLADADNPLPADLVALATELIGRCDDANLPILARATPLILALIKHPERANAEAVIHLLEDDGWPEPLDAEDIADQRALLDEVFEAAAPAATPAVTESTAAAEPITEPAPQVTDEADACAAEAAELPGFCDIDMTLLQQAGPSVDPGILTMLVGSLQALQEQWQNASAEQAEPLLEASVDALTPLGRACTTIQMHGLNLLLSGLVRNLNWFLQHPNCFHAAECTHFADCLQAVHQHLEALGDKSTREDLIDAISDERLPIHADPQQGAFISGLLALASIQSPDEIECETATPEDVVLAVGDEIDPQLMEMLYDELPVLVEEFQTHLQAVVVDHEADSLLSAQRAAHTIKGLANMAGIKGLANLTHHLEDILEVLTNAKTFPGSKLTRDLTTASDCLAQMSESITEDAEAPDNAQQQLQLMMTWFYRLQTEGVDAAGEALSDADRAAQPEPPTPDRSSASSSPKQAAASSHDGEKEHAHLRVPVGILDNLFRIAGESSTLNAQLDDTLTQLRRLSRSNRERQRALQKVLFDLEQQLQDHFTLNSHLHEDDSDFDPLEMDRYNSMHTTLSQLQEAVADVREVDMEADHQLRQLAELHVRQNNLQKESLDNVLHTRLVAVKTISSRMQRIMRQACSTAGKEARLVIEGEDVMMDSQILNQLADPLMHIIRNAVDHGLETPHLRFEAGKDETGTLTIRFSQQNGKVYVSCEDDGGGINLKRVREIAEHKGLITPDTELSERDIQRLILVPGFSTREEISQLSGRGIGMDVVYQQVTRMQGSLNIDSTPGQGSRFELSMPASSLLVHTLLVRSDSQRVFALSSHTVEQSILSLDGELKQTDNGLTFTTAEGVFPAYTLESLIGEPSRDYHGTRIHPVLLIHLDHGRKAAVLVREVLAHRELVFKPLGEHLPDIAGIPGVTILANGEVAPIIDLQARILDRDSILGPAHDVSEAAFELRLPHVLVVDDSLSARKTLATLLSDSGYQVTTAIDGLDALDKVRSDPPELILTDLEMPRMTGMELAAIIRNSDQFSKIPVVMITSRSTHKHRGEAEAVGVSAYLTKPWTEAGVLDTVQSLLF